MELLDEYSGLVRFLDKDLENITEIGTYITLIWHEKYFGTGYVEFQTFEYIENAKYIYNVENRQLAVIEKLEEFEYYFKYSGFTLEHLIKNKVINKKMTFQDKSKEEIVSLLLKEFASDVVTTADVTEGRKIGTVQVFGENLLEYCQATLKTIGKGIKVDYDYITQEKLAVIFQGDDNTVNKPPLSENFDNIVSDAFTINSEGYRNYAYIKGEKENEIVVELDLRKTSNEPKKEMFIDGSSVTRKNEDVILSEVEYREALLEYGNIIMIRYNTNKTTVVVPYPDNFELGEQRLYQGKYSYSHQRVIEILTGWESGVKRQNIKLS